jgi:membrane-bound lytic murein transglycosylase D
VKAPAALSGLVAILVGTSGVWAAPPPPRPRTPPAPTGTPHRPDLARLKTLVEAAEKAGDAEDWDTASTRIDEAEVLVADWPEATLAIPEAMELMERIHAVEDLVLEAEAPPAEDPGFKIPEEVVALQGADLKAEQEHVKAAEAGAVFDFPIDLNDKVLAFVRAFTVAKRGFMEGALTRGSRYLPMIRHIFAEEGIPQDLCYLALIESGYRNAAQSTAQAVGMWQFIRATGRIYGLGGNAWVEERRDPAKATRAAARYLKRLHDSSGDWYLALLGYNAGPLTGERAIQNLGTRNFWDLARSRHLRTETKNYVPSLCAAILIGRFPERYGFKIQPGLPYAYETVEVDRMTSLAVLSRFAATDVEALKDLNPELLRATTPPGRYLLKVPPGQGQITAKALSAIPAGQRLDFQTYRIRRGDTLARVAARFHLTGDDLLQANGMTKLAFKTGRSIQVPPAPTVPIDKRDLLPPAERPRTRDDKPLDPLPSFPGEAVAPTAQEAVPVLGRRTAAPSATSASVAAGTGPALAAPLQAAPDPAPKAPAGSADLPSAVTPAPDVPVPAAPGGAPAGPKAAAEGTVPGRHPKPATPPRSAKAAKAAKPVAEAATHTVKAGDSLFSIAHRAGISLAELKTWNRLKGSVLRPGQKLRLTRP